MKLRIQQIATVPDEQYNNSNERRRRQVRSTIQQPHNHSPSNHHSEDSAAYQHKSMTTATVTKSTTKSRCVGLTTGGGGTRTQLRTTSNLNAGTFAVTNRSRRSSNSTPNNDSNPSHSPSAVIVLHGRVLRKLPDTEQELSSKDVITTATTHSWDDDYTLNKTTTSSIQNTTTSQRNRSNMTRCRSNHHDITRYLLERKRVYTQLVEATKQFHEQIITLENVIKGNGTSNSTNSDSDIYNGNEDTKGKDMIEKDWRIQLLLSKAQNEDSRLWKELYDYETTLSSSSLSLSSSSFFIAEQEEEIRHLQTSCMKLHTDFKRSHKLLLMCISLLNDSNMDIEKDYNGKNRSDINSDDNVTIPVIGTDNDTTDIATNSCIEQQHRRIIIPTTKTSPMVEGVGWTATQLQQQTQQQQIEQAPAQSIQFLNIEIKEGEKKESVEDDTLKFSRSVSPIYTSFKQNKSKVSFNNKDSHQTINKTQSTNSQLNSSSEYEDEYYDEEDDYEEDMFDKFTNWLGFDIGTDDLKGRNISIIKMCGTNNSNPDANIKNVENKNKCLSKKIHDNIARDDIKNKNNNKCICVHDLLDDLYDQNYCITENNNKITEKQGNCSTGNNYGNGLNNVSSRTGLISAAAAGAAVNDKNSKKKTVCSNNKATTSHECKNNDISCEDEMEEEMDGSYNNNSVTKYSWYQQFQHQLHTIQLDLLHVRSNSNINTMVEDNQYHNNEKILSSRNRFINDKQTVPLDEN